MKFELSIIIPTLNYSSHLNNLINNICQQLNYKKFQIIIINQSHRGVSKTRKNKVIYKYTSKKNLSRARNIGLDLAAGKFICFLDDDIFLTPNYFLKCLNKFKINKNISIFFSRILNKEDGKIYSRYMSNNSEKINYNNNLMCLSSGMWAKKSDLLRHKIKFDERLGLGAKYGSSEETDFLMQCLLKNLNIFFFSDIQLYHRKYILNKLPIKKIISRSYSYGMGRGALLAKYSKIKPMWFLFNLFFSIFPQLIISFFSLLTFDVKKFSRFFFSFLGRVVGLLNFFFKEKSL